MDNIFCIDLEDWYHQSVIPACLRADTPRIERNTDRLLALFAESDTQATFFCLGQVAKRHPALIRRIQAMGHEIACHGYGHQIITGQTPEAFREDVKSAKGLLEDIVGKAVKGYRAPSWTITRRTIWALSILQELGFRYDSSIFPVSNFLYGIPDAPVFTHCLTVDGKPLWEIPPSTFSILGKNMGFSGGFYFRALPYAMIKRLTGRINRQKQPAVFYLHPVEIDPDCPKIKTSLRDTLILYHGVRGCEKKLRRILNTYHFVPIETYYHF